MKKTQNLPRLVLMGMILLAVALMGTVTTPITATAEGGAGDPPINAPVVTDTITGGGGSTAGDSAEDLADDMADSYSPIGDGGLLYELLTLIPLL